MRSILFGLVAATCVVAVLLAQDPATQPTCAMCPATYISSGEVQAYVKKAMAEKLTDQQIRDVEIGKALEDEAASKAYLAKPAR